MSDHGPIFDPDLIRETFRPLQRAGAPTLIRETAIPPEGHVRDVRWIIDREALVRLLAVAERSPTGRVIIHRATIQVRLWQDGDHRYETLSLASPLPPEPEVVGVKLGANAGDGIAG